MTCVQQVSMIMTLILQLRAQTAVQANTRQQDRYHAVNVRQDMQTRTVIRRLHARCAVRASMLQQGTLFALNAP